MNIGSRGDTAHSYAMQSRNAALKQDMQRLTLEISTGQVADIRTALAGNVAYLNDLDRSLTKLDGYKLAGLEAQQFADGVQTALGRISDLNASFRDSLLTATNSALGDGTTGLQSTARDKLDQTISALNTQVSGRTLFAGTATNVQPIASVDDLLTGLRAAVTGAVTVDDIFIAAQAWFDDPAGFGTTGYLGSDTALAPVALSDSDSVGFKLRGDDTVLRDTLRNLALMAMADDPALSLNNTQKSELLQKTMTNVFANVDDVIQLRATVGTSEAHIETATVRQSSERSALEMARNNLLSVDPFEAATELEQVQFQLQSLYAITARSSQLSLVNYL
ncbi:flagellin [Sulfitobacter sp.]|uniref:flagellin n=1 Tax=Sulfitobacter sp. TaxID=1903071 RepID=UPI003001CA4D